MTRTALLLAAAIGLSGGATARTSASAPLIPRDALFGNPQKTAGRISPDGKWLSWIAPREGVLNVWVAPASNPSAARAGHGGEDAAHPPIFLGA